MAENTDDPATLRVSTLSTKRETSFDLRPDNGQMRAIADSLGISALRKARLSGHVAPQGNRGWVVQATLGATVVQPCVITLDPVTTRLDEPVERRFLPSDLIDKEVINTTEDGIEMPEDDSVEPLADTIDLHTILIEALALALPQYPRAQGADLGAAQFTEDGIAPLRDEDLKPFAGLQALRDKLGGTD